MKCNGSQVRGGLDQIGSSNTGRADQIMVRLEGKRSRWVRALPLYGGEVTLVKQGQVNQDLYRKILSRVIEPWLQVLTSLTATSSFSYTAWSPVI